MNILILRVSAIGDVIHTLPAVLLIKHIYPNAKITWVVQKKVASLLIGQPFLNKVVVLPDKFLYKINWSTTIKIIKELKTAKWDAILDFQGILKTSLLTLFLSGKKYGFDFRSARLWATSFFTTKHTRPIYQNIIQKNLALVNDMLVDKKDSIKTMPTIESIKKSFKFYIKNNDKKIVDNWFFKNQIKNYIILAPNTTWQSKLWPEKNWKKLIELLSSNINFSNKFSILLLGKDFGEQAKNIANFIEKNKIKTFIVPKWDLLKNSYLISKSSLIIAPDTGLLHIADFLGKKAIGIFGPTSAKKHGPFLTKENIKNVIQIDCPHHYQKTHGKRSNEKDNCMDRLTPQNLYTKIITFLDEKKLEGKSYEKIIIIDDINSNNANFLSNNPR